MDDGKHVEFVEAHEESGESLLKQWKSFRWSDFLAKNLLFLVWLTLLGFVYIGNRYHAEKIARRITTIKKEVQNLRAESITTAASLMYLSRQSVVKKMVQDADLPLEESVTPPYILKK